MYNRPMRLHFCEFSIWSLGVHGWPISLSVLHQVQYNFQLNDLNFKELCLFHSTATRFQQWWESLWRPNAWIRSSCVYRWDLYSQGTVLTISSHGYRRHICTYSYHGFGHHGRYWWRWSRGTPDSTTSLLLTERSYCTLWVFNLYLCSHQIHHYPRLTSPREKSKCGSWLRSCLSDDADSSHGFFHRCLVQHYASRHGDSGNSSTSPIFPYFLSRNQSHGGL